MRLAAGVPGSSFSPGNAPAVLDRGRGKTKRPLYWTVIPANWTLVGTDVRSSRNRLLSPHRRTSTVTPDLKRAANSAAESVLSDLDAADLENGRPARSAVSPVRNSNSGVARAPPLTDPGWPIPTVIIV